MPSSDPALTPGEPEPPFEPVVAPGTTRREPAKCIRFDAAEVDRYWATQPPGARAAQAAAVEAEVARQSAIAAAKWR